MTFSHMLADKALLDYRVVILNLLMSTYRLKKRKKQEGIKILKTAQYWIKEIKRERRRMIALLSDLYKFNADYGYLEKAASEIESGNFDSESGLRKTLREAEDLQAQTLSGEARIAGVHIPEDYHEMLRESRR